MDTKFCKDCQQDKTVDAFPRQPRNKDGLNTYCRQCQSSRTKASPNYKGNLRKAQLKSFYGITPEIYSDLFDLQNGVCAICGSDESESMREHLCVDHDHSTGVVRGLLCHSCNIGLGKFKDDSELLKKAIIYLQK